jgi:hypothetical protein
VTFIHSFSPLFVFFFFFLSLTGFLGESNDCNIILILPNGVIQNPEMAK